jgi:hypothetical protein
MTSTRQAVVLIHGIGEQRPMDTLLVLVRQFRFALRCQEQASELAEAD